MKKILSVLIVLILALSCFSAAAYAAPAGVPVGSEADVRAAIAAGESEIYLTTDIHFNGDLRTNSDITIDLGEYDITFANTMCICIDGGTMTLNGNGTITSNWSCAVQVKPSAANATAGLVVNGPTITGETYYGVLIEGKGPANTGFLTLNSGTIQGPRGGFVGNGTASNFGTVVNINGGLVTATLNDDATVGIYHPQIGVLNINGGTVRGGTGIMAKAGTINVTGGTVIGTGAYTVPQPVQSGAEISGAGIGLSSNAGYAGNITLNITGGSVLSEQAYAVAHYSSNMPEGGDNIDGILVDAGATLVSPMDDVTEIIALDAVGEPVNLVETQAAYVVINEAAALLSNTTQNNTEVIANSAPSYIIIIPELVDFGTVTRAMGVQTKDFFVRIEDALLDYGATVTVDVSSDFLMKNAASADKTLAYQLYNTVADGEALSTGARYCVFGLELENGAPGLIDSNTYAGTVSGRVTTNPALLTRAGAYSDTMVFVCEYKAA